MADPAAVIPYTIGVHPARTSSVVLCALPAASLPARREMIMTHVAGSVALTLFAGLMSGLTLGLMSLDNVDLEVLKRSGTPREKAYASKIMPVGSMAARHCLFCICLPMSGTPQSSDLRNTGRVALHLTGSLWVQVVARPHLLLVTLLLANAAAMEASIGMIAHMNPTVEPL